MNEMHGDWLRINYNSGVRAALKKKYGVFAGKEKSDFPGIKRRAGTPTLVIIGPGFEEYGLYDCDDGGNGLKLLKSKGAGAFDDWAKHAWDDVPRGSSAAVLPTGLENEVLSLQRLEAEWAEMEKTSAALQAALLEKVDKKRGPSLEWGRLVRGCARLKGWLKHNDAR